jgi:hypothetical protein
VREIWWRTFAGGRRNSGYFWHVATRGEVMKESREKKRKATPQVGNKSRTTRDLIVFSVVIVVSRATVSC